MGSNLNQHLLHGVQVNFQINHLIKFQKIKHINIQILVQVIYVKKVFKLQLKKIYNLKNKSKSKNIMTTIMIITTTTIIIITTIITTITTIIIIITTINNNFHQMIYNIMYQTI